MRNILIVDCEILGSGQAGMAKVAGARGHPQNGRSARATRIIL